MKIIHKGLGFPGGSVAKNLATDAGDSSSTFALERFPGEGKWQLASGILAWRILWTEEPGELLSTGLQRVGHDLLTKQQHEELIFRIYRNNVRIYKELIIQ